jgi:hypothetical protein
MGKASSSKKVARAAGLGGGRAYAKRPAWGYYFGVLVLLVLGVVGVYNSREYRDAAINKQGNTAPVVHQKPPWYEGYAIDECGKILPPIKTTKDPYGITTKDGVISVSPTVKAAAGRNATLGKFASSIGMQLNAGEIETPGGRLWQDGATCECSKTPRASLARPASRTPLVSKTPATLTATRVSSSRTTSW